MNVSPTRVNLLNTKKRLKSAERGYRLLKDKRDGLMKTFIEVVREARDTREDVAHRLRVAFKHYLRANARTPKRVGDAALMIPGVPTHIAIEEKNVMSVSVPQFEVEKSGSVISYGFLETSGELDKALYYLDEIIPQLLHLAELEKTAQRLADEIEKTRRRVSALEHIMIPELQKTIKIISMRLEEQNRQASVAAMRVKAMIESGK